MKKSLLPIFTAFLVTVSQVLSGGTYSVEETGQQTDCDGKLHHQIEVSDGTTTLSALIPGFLVLEDADEEGAFYYAIDWKANVHYCVSAFPLAELLETDIVIVDQDSLEEAASLDMATESLDGTVEAITCPADNVIAAVEVVGIDKEDGSVSITRLYATSNSLFLVEIDSFTSTSECIGSPSCDFVMDSIEIR